MWLETGPTSRPPAARPACPGLASGIAVQRSLLSCKPFGVLFLRLMPPGFSVHYKNVICYACRRVSETKHTQTALHDCADRNPSCARTAWKSALCAAPPPRAAPRPAPRGSASPHRAAPRPPTARLRAPPTARLRAPPSARLGLPQLGRVSGDRARLGPHFGCLREAGREMVQLGDQPLSERERGSSSVPTSSISCP